MRVFLAGASGAIGRQLTPLLVEADLPDVYAEVPAKAAANRRMRTEGTRNLVAAAAATEREPKLLAQSIAWKLPPGRGAALAEHEQMVLDAGGVVVRYGQFYGPGTFYHRRRVTCKSSPVCGDDLQVRP